MTTYTDKDRSIIAQVAAKIASEITASGNSGGATFRQAAELAQSVIFDLAAAPIGGASVTPIAAAPSAQAAVAPVATDFAAEIAADDPLNAVTEVFPGAQVTGNLSNVPPHAEGRDIKLTKEQRKDNKEWAMQLLAHDQSLFWDNRADKASGEKSSGYPDFKHKESGVGLWLD